VSLSLTYTNIKQIHSLLGSAEHPLTLLISGLREEDEVDEVNTDETGLTPMQLIEHIQTGIQVFKTVNIPDELIKIGTTMREG
jgi:hypothetical protein